jgi:hypothetical protein
MSAIAATLRRAENRAWRNAARRINADLDALIAAKKAMRQGPPSPAVLERAHRASLRVECSLRGLKQVGGANV